MTVPQPDGSSTQPDGRPAGRQRSGRALVVSGGVLLLVAVVLGAVSVGELVTSAARGLTGAFDEPTFATPTAIHRTLQPGVWIVYEMNGPTTADPELSLSPAQVSVTAPDGTPVPVFASSEFSFSRSGNPSTESGAAFAQFSVTTTGTYRVAVRGSGQQVMLAAAPLTALSSATTFGWLVGVAGAVFVGFIGLALALIGLTFVARNRPTRPAGDVAAQPGDVAGSGPPGPSAAPLPPAGWYPDPDRPGGLRYWDGRAWTGFSG